MRAVFCAKKSGLAAFTCGDADHFSPLSRLFCQLRTAIPPSHPFRLALLKHADPPPEEGHGGWSDLTTPDFFFFFFAVVFFFVLCMSLILFFVCIFQRSDSMRP